MIYYADYLNLDTLLNSQQPESEKAGARAHDEMLFIITHQTFELWFKQVLFEVGSVIQLLDRDYVPEADVSLCQARLRRVNRIMEHLCNQFNLIETMTPGEFMDFRGFLNPASGFQSVQWRVLERTLGLPEQTRVLKHYTDALSPDHRAQVEAAGATTLFDVLQRWLEKTPFLESGEYAFWAAYQSAVSAMLEHDRDEVRSLAAAEHRDPADALAQIDGMERGFHALFEESEYRGLLERGERRMSQRATLAILFISTYRDYPLLQLPYRLMDAIIELDKYVSLWRYRHTMMVSRMIGMRVGTGGSSGHEYLMRTTVRQRVFDDVTALSSFLLPTPARPQLPAHIAERLQFVNESPSAKNR
jgi:tryptophan 2,3-dioxygenase